MKEIISINVGQAGIQLGNSAWELFCMEHGIRSDGRNICEDSSTNSESAEILFLRVNDCFVPRSLQIDFEPTVLDEVRVGAYRRLFNPNFMISGFEDSSSNFARGFFTQGRKFKNPALKVIRKLSEQSDSLQGFCFVNSFDGGTGSGFTSLLEEEMSTTSSKISKFQLGIYPSKMLSSSTVYPYNALLHTHFAIDHTDMCPVIDNGSLYTICTDLLHIEQVTFTNINRIVAQVFSNFTVSLRFQCSLSNSISQLCTNLVPYPRIHFVLAHLAPICTEAVREKSLYSISDITNEVFLYDHQMAYCDTLNSKFMACMLQYRGDVIPVEVNNAVNSIKNMASIQFVDWCPTGFKIGISSQPSASPPSTCLAQTPRNVTMLSNSNAVVEIWEHLQSEFDCLYNRKAFVHWFLGEGLELDEFIEAKNTILKLMADYYEISETKQTIKEPK